MILTLIFQLVRVQHWSKYKRLSDQLSKDPCWRFSIGPRSFCPHPKANREHISDEKIAATRSRSPSNRRTARCPRHGLVFGRRDQWRSPQRRFHRVAVPIVDYYRQIVVIVVLSAGPDRYLRRYLSLAAASNSRNVSRDVNPNRTDSARQCDIVFAGGRVPRVRCGRNNNNTKYRIIIYRNTFGFISVRNSAAAGDLKQQ